jgi:hypothetical protein
MRLEIREQNKVHEKPVMVKRTVQRENGSKLLTYLGYPPV